MPNNWKTYTLDEICNRITDGSHSSPKEVKNGNYQIATVKDMNDYGLYLHQCKRISDIDFESLKNQDCVPEKGDVLFSKDGTIGKVLLFDFDYKIGVLSSIAIFRPKKELIDSMFLSYYLKEQTNNNFIKDNFRSGSAIPRIILRDFKKYNLTVPELPEQQSIAAILSAIDDKIENNLAINKTLEEMAMALYKHWFVDFGPFQDGEFVETELGRIPKGWEIGKLEDLLEIKYGKDHKKLKSGKIPVYGSGGVMRYVNESLYDKESILIPRKGTLSNLFYISEPFWSVDTMFYSKIKDVNFGKYIFYFLKSLDLASMDVGSAVPSLTTELLKRIKIIIPQKKIIYEVNELLNLKFTAIESNTKENQTLTQLRDTLLPKLISGEVRLKEFRE